MTSVQFAVQQPKFRTGNDVNNVPPGYTPTTALGSDLYAYWEANDATTITQTGNEVTEWRDKVAGLAAVPPSTGARPIYEPTGFRGTAPGVSFDGVDDCLQGSAATFPLGNTACELWVLASNNSAVGVSTTVFSYGNGATVTTSVDATANNMFSASVGTGSSSVFFSLGNEYWTGPGVARLLIGPTSTTLTGNDRSALTQSFVSDKVGNRFRIGARPGGTPIRFLNGRVAAVLVTKPLAFDKASVLMSFLKARAGVP